VSLVEVRGILKEQVQRFLAGTSAMATAYTARPTGVAGVFGVMVKPNGTGDGVLGKRRGRGHAGLFRNDVQATGTLTVDCRYCAQAQKGWQAPEMPCHPRLERIAKLAREMPQA